VKSVNPRIKRKRRIRKDIRGSKSKPRLSVFRSNKYIYVQAIDDEKGMTLASSSEKALSSSKRHGKKIEVAKLVGKDLGEKLKKIKIVQCVFDRGGYKYHGRVKALAEGVRESGIKF
jgi:large subunit ribosomal protein L18